MARETIVSIKSQKKKKWISDATYAAIMEKRKAKGKDKNRYQELKAEVQTKLRVDKQQQLEGMRIKLEAANSKGNSRKLFQIVKSMTRKFQPRLQGIQFATGENLTEAAQVADSWKGYCEDLYCDEEGKGIKQAYWEQEPPPLRSEVARAIRQTVSRKATGLMRSQQNCSKQEEIRYWAECTEYVWRSGKLVSGQRNGRSPRSSHFQERRS